jgi:hypothetical protein
MLAVLTVGPAAGRANAQEGFGLHGGATIDPDHGFFGMYYISRPLAGTLRIHPGADVGFGDDSLLAALHVDLAQWFEINPRWHLYFGAGPTVNIYRLDLRPSGDNDMLTDVDGGFETMVGFVRDRRWQLEMRVGANGSPDLRFTVGYTFE